MSEVRAKFVVCSISRSQYYRNHGEMQTIKLTPVTDGSDEDKRFYASTPTGSIELGVLNKEAGDRFELGATYYVDFTKAA